MSGLLGSFASASGYGQTQGGYGQTQGGYGGKEIECNSALGLIGLLGLIELLRDIIENMTTPAEEEERRRRSVSGGVFRNSLVGSLFRGGADTYHPLGSLPALLLPLLHSAVDASDNLQPLSCFERTLCETNRALISKGTAWGVPGAFLANSTSSFVSNVIAKAFTDDGEAYIRALEAGEAGRLGVDCKATYSRCTDLPPQYKIFKGVDVNTVVREHLAEMT